MNNTHIEVANAVFSLECEAIKFVQSKINASFSDAVNKILNPTGRVVICGMGKSGHIGKKIFATFVSTGTPSIFMHPAEAFHGDLGMILPEDIFLAISNSGETEEIVKLIPFLKDNQNTLISMTGNPKSTLAKCSHVHLDVGVETEACPLQLAPTSSTTAALVMGDALAVSLMKARNFQPENFARFHPGGSLGRRLLGRVNDYMKPAVTIHVASDFKMVLSKLTDSIGGIVCVLEHDKLVGVITDGDLRRKLTNNDVAEVISLTAGDLMSNNPWSVSSDTRCSDADSMMVQKGVNSLLAFDHVGDLFIYQNLNRVKL